jgi:hypothetical protein
MPGRTYIGKGQRGTNRAGEELNPMRVTFLPLPGSHCVPEA